MESNIRLLLYFFSLSSRKNEASEQQAAAEGAGERGPEVERGEGGSEWAWQYSGPAGKGEEGQPG